jgi:putative ABC transport system ATP-binding protein
MTYGQEEPKVHALRSLDLAIPGGQFLVVRGRSGSGKTTLFHLLAGMKRPTSGRVMVGDVEVNALSEAESARFRRHKIGLVYQFFNLVPVLTCREHRTAAAARRSPTDTAARERVDGEARHRGSREPRSEQALGR